MEINRVISELGCTTQDQFHYYVTTLTCAVWQGGLLSYNLFFLHLEASIRIDAPKNQQKVLILPIPSLLSTFFVADEYLNDQTKHFLKKVLGYSVISHHCQIQLNN